jgi:hypothetical protein
MGDLHRQRLEGSVGSLLTRKFQFTDGLRQQGLEISVHPSIDGAPVPTGECRLNKSA